MKICNKCSLPRDTSLFYKRDNGKLRNECKLCLANYRLLNRGHIAKKKLEWCSKNKEYLADFSANYYSLNKEKAHIRNNIYIINRKKNDINFKLMRNLRSRLNAALKNNYKVGSAVDDLGCSIAELKVYLESKFQPGMSWDNWSKYGWHIDHIKPLSSFDLTNPNQLKQACHYLNLQPLWATDNLRKNKYG